MAKLKAISEKIVAELPAPAKGNKLHYASGLTLQGKKAPSGFAVRVTAAGTKAFCWFHRVSGTGYIETIGTWEGNPTGGDYAVRAAIIEADRRAKAVRDRAEDPRPERTRRLQDGEKPNGLDIAGLFDQFVERYVKKEAKLRSAHMIETQLNRLAKPEIGNIGVYEIRRKHVVAMLDEIADENGPRMADLVLAYVRKAFNWHAVRDDQFLSPIVKGMARTNSKERARKRILADDEIRDLWAALETVPDVPACFPAFVKMLLLTATRRNESAKMSTIELEGELWTIPADRYKNKLDHVIPLPAAVRELIDGLKPEKARKNASFIFSTTDGEKPFSGFSKSKVALQKAIAEIREREGRPPMQPWVFHDLRRTARTLMSRAGVQPDHAERCLGHIIIGVRGVYDRFEYLDEKRDAFEALAALVFRILNPTANVEELAARRPVQS